MIFTNNYTNKMSTTLPVEKTKAITAFRNADERGKTLLSDLFGKEVFNQKITDRVRSYEDACEVLEMVPEYFGNDSKDEIAYKKLKVIVRALNEGWTPDWSNSNQYKYYPWFCMGAKFRFDYYAVISGSSTMGSRLCVKSSELANYLGEQFTALYNDFLN